MHYHTHTHAYIYHIYIYTHYTHAHNTRVRIIAVRFDCYHVVSIVIRRIHTHIYIYIEVMLDYANYVIKQVGCSLRMIYVFGLWLLLFKRYPKSVCLFATDQNFRHLSCWWEIGSGSTMWAAHGRTAFRWWSQSLNERIACARHLARFRVQARWWKTAPIVTNSGHSNPRISPTKRQGFGDGTLYLDRAWWNTFCTSFELKHGMTSTKRRCGSFSLGPAGRNADIFDFELSEAEMRSWIEMREMVQTEVVDSACTHTQITHFSETWMTLCLNHRRFQHAPKHFCFNVLWEQFPLRYPHAAELGSFCISQNAKSWFFEVPKTPKVDFLQFGENRKVDFLDSRRPGKSFFPFFLDSLILIATDPNAFPNLGGFLVCSTAKASWMRCHCWLTTSKDLQWRIFFPRTWVAWRSTVPCRSTWWRCQRWFDLIWLRSPDISGLLRHGLDHDYFGVFVWGWWFLYCLSIHFIFCGVACAISKSDPVMQ